MTFSGDLQEYGVPCFIIVIVAITERKKAAEKFFSAAFFCKVAYDSKSVRVEQEIY